MKIIKVEWNSNFFLSFELKNVDKDCRCYISLSFYLILYCKISLDRVFNLLSADIIYTKINKEFAGYLIQNIVSQMNLLCMFLLHVLLQTTAIDIGFFTANKLAFDYSE